MGPNERLKAERERLGFTQTEFAGLADASKKSQIRWEQGESHPGMDALIAWAKVGLDVMYVLTGQRGAACAAMPVEKKLKPEHVALIDNYEHCAPEDQAAIRRITATSAQSQVGKKTARKAG